MVEECYYCGEDELELLRLPFDVYDCKEGTLLCINCYKDTFKIICEICGEGVITEDWEWADEYYVCKNCSEEYYDPTIPQ